MITFTQFGKKGRLGNQLFQYAAMLGLAKKFERSFDLKEWNYANYFPAVAKRINNHQPLFAAPLKIKERYFHYDDLDYSFSSYKYNLDFEGYFQSEKYWQHCVDEVKSELRIEHPEVSAFANKYKHIFKKPTIAISIRRGDYVNNPNYELLSVTYYFLALQEHFPDWEKYNILIFSDDTAYCRIHFSCLPNVTIVANNFNNDDKSTYYHENSAAVNQLYLATLCDHFIIANSTFSWWMAYLGEKQHSKIIRPAHHFAGKMKTENIIKDYYPERWTKFDHKLSDVINKKIDLSDVLFTIPVSYDHKDRKENLDLNIKMLLSHFKCQILVGEQGSDKFSYVDSYVDYIKFPFKDFHRTRMLNMMAKETDLPIVANWDADVFMSPIQIWYSVQKIREGADVVYPYDGRFARVPRNIWYSLLKSFNDVGIFGASVFAGTMPGEKKSVGGAIFFKTEKFFEGGGENEKFISYGPEDAERYHRFVTLGYKVIRTKGILYHMDHYCGPNSGSQDNPFVKDNRAEWHKIEKMNKEQLTDYIKTWTHLK